VRVRYPRKQVVLDLEVQASNEPGEQPVVAREIHRSLDLVRRPLDGHAWVGGGRRRVFGLLDAVGELENHRQHEPDHQRRRA